MEKLPLYKIVVNPNDDSGVYAVSLVDEPAIEVDWIKLNKMIDIQFSVNKDKQLLYGPLLVPEKRIYRRDDNGYEYDIMFDKETIAIIAEKYNKNKFNDAFNFQHSDKKVEAYLVENWLVENPDKSNKYGFDLEDGTWFGGVKVEDTDFWLEAVKTEMVKGFSVEIKCDVELVKFNKQKINKLSKMEVKRKDGVVIYYDGELGVGTKLFVDAEMTQPAPEGEHELEDGTIVVVNAEGAIAEVKVKEEDVVEEDMSETPTTTEVVETKLNNEEVLSIVQPLFDEFKTAYSELEAKLAELEAKLTETKKENQELSSKLEVLSKTPGAETITKKDDRAEIFKKKEEQLLSKIRAFSKL